ncbi:MAG TPA: DUF2062 domain-containing protein [bacterium]|nr:DUF2062 domain-containing protein [bacterium]HQN72484.1 DUF2062 domain-containing protein [bacterium]HQO91114.1 DUF2062 domain-containing protein [bacterium]
MTSNMINMEPPKKVPWYDLKGQFISIWKKLLSLNDSPHDIALGLALGIFIGFLPIMGIQMTVVLVFALPFRNANKVAAVAGVWITNPLTVIPIYAFIYWVGTAFYPAEYILTSESLKCKMRDIIQLDGFIDQTQAFLSLGADIFLPMCIGGAIVGFIAMFPTYFITRKLIENYRKK